MSMKGMAVNRHPRSLMEGIMLPERPSYRLDLQVPHRRGHSSFWSDYGTYRTVERAMQKAAPQTQPCRIVECRVVWRSVPIRQHRR
jgi:hypothetical protein